MSHGRKPLPEETKAIPLSPEICEIKNIGPHISQVCILTENKMAYLKEIKMDEDKNQTASVEIYDVKNQTLCASKLVDLPCTIAAMNGHLLIALETGIFKFANFSESPEEIVLFPEKTKIIKMKVLPNDRILFADVLESSLRDLQKKVTISIEIGDTQVQWGPISDDKFFTFNGEYVTFHTFEEHGFEGVERMFALSADLIIPLSKATMAYAKKLERSIMILDLRNDRIVTFNTDNGILDFLVTSEDKLICAEKNGKIQIFDLLDENKCIANWDLEGMGDMDIFYNEFNDHVICVSDNKILDINCGIKELYKKEVSTCLSADTSGIVLSYLFKPKPIDAWPKVQIPSISCKLD